MKKIMVENLEGFRGEAVRNQFVIETEKGKYFQSYRTIICYINKTGEIIADIDAENYSVTTSKYLYKFLRDYSRLSINNKKEFLQAVKEGKIKRENLNE